MNTMTILTELQAVLAKATEAGVLDQMAGAYTNPDVINGFCDAVAAMLKDQGIVPKGS